MTKRDALRAACIAATVATCWGTSDPCYGYEVRTVVVTKFVPFHSLAVMRFVGMTELTYLRLGALAAVPANQTVFSSFDIPTGTDGTPVVFSRYFAIGANLDTTSSSVMISFGDTSPWIGTDFSVLFPGVSESSIASANIDGSPNLLDPILDRLSREASVPTAVEMEAGTVKFSTGVAGGTVLMSFSPIPEPSTAVMCLGGLGVGALLRRRAV